MEKIVCLHFQKLSLLKYVSEASKLCPNKQYSPSLPFLKFDDLNVWVVCGKRQLLTTFAIVFFKVAQELVMF